MVTKEQMAENGRQRDWVEAVRKTALRSMSDKAKFANVSLKGTSIYPRASVTLGVEHSTRYGRDVDLADFAARNDTPGAVSVVLEAAADLAADPAFQSFAETHYAAIVAQASE